jgi:hypothetical protein
MTATQRQVLAAIEANGVEQPGFFGVLSFHFQNGRLTLIRREQTTIPQPSNDKERNSNASVSR